MALTDAERQLLDELEATLTAQDPKLASKFSQPQRRVHPAKAVGGVVGFLIGLVGLVAGMMSYWWVSVVGFIIMLASAIIVISAWSKPSTGDISSIVSQPSESMMTKLEKRWQDRQQM